MNPRRASRFDDGEKPPEPDYPDWKKEDTRVAGFSMDDMSYSQMVAWVGLTYGPILEEISGPDISELQNVAYFRLYKLNKIPKVRL